VFCFPSQVVAQGHQQENRGRRGGQGDQRDPENRVGVGRVVKHHCRALGGGHNGFRSVAQTQIVAERIVDLETDICFVVRLAVPPLQQVRAYRGALEALLDLVVVSFEVLQLGAEQDVMIRDHAAQQLVAGQESIRNGQGERSVREDRTSGGGIHSFLADVPVVCAFHHDLHLVLGSVLLPVRDVGGQPHPGYHCCGQGHEHCRDQRQRVRTAQLAPVRVEGREPAHALSPT